MGQKLYMHAQLDLDHASNDNIVNIPILLDGWLEEITNDVVVTEDIAKTGPAIVDCVVIWYVLNRGAEVFFLGNSLSNPREIGAFLVGTTDIAAGWFFPDIIDPRVMFVHGESSPSTQTIQTINLRRWVKANTQIDVRVSMFPFETAITGKFESNIKIKQDVQNRK